MPRHYINGLFAKFNLNDTRHNITAITPVVTTKCRIIFIVMLNVIAPSVVMLNAIMLNVVTLNVVMLNVVGLP